MTSARGLWLLVGGFIAAVAAVVGIVQVTRDHHPGGDPGGHIMAVLSKTDAAIPPNAEIVFRRDDGPRWDSCDGRAGTFGWDDVVFQVQFSSSRPAAVIVAGAEAALSVKGWSRLNVFGDRADAEWIADARLPGGSVSLERGNDGKWMLTATAPPVGHHASGC